MLGVRFKRNDQYFGRGHPRLSGKGRTRVWARTAGWAIGILALAAGLTYQGDSPTVVPATSLPFVNENGPVKAIAFRPDGGLLLATFGNVWRIVGDHPDVVCPELPGTCLAFSPDGTLLALGEESKVTIREVTTGRTNLVLTSPIGRTLALAFSPDGGTLVVAGDRSVSVWDLGSGREWTGLHSGLVGVTSLAFTTDGRTLAMGDRRGYVQVWELTVRRSRGRFRAHALAVASLEFSRDGQTLVSTSFMDAAARLWDTATFRPIASLQHHLAPVQAAAFAPSGRMLATAGRDGAVRLWDSATGRVLAVLSGNDNGVCVLVFSKDGRTLVSGGVGESVWSWDLTALPWQVD